MYEVEIAYEMLRLLDTGRNAINFVSIQRFPILGDPNHRVGQNMAVEHQPREALIPSDLTFVDFAAI